MLTLWQDLDAGEVSAQDMAHAITLAQFYLSEAARLAEAATVSVEIERAEKLRKWLQESWGEADMHKPRWCNPALMHCEIRKRRGQPWLSLKATAGLFDLIRARWCAARRARMRGASCAGNAMWFDAQAALARIGGGDAPLPASTRPVQCTPGIAGIAEIAGGTPADAEQLRKAAPQQIETPYGTSPGGRPLTYTGRVVSLEAWRALSEWERHGPHGRIWDGRTKQWQQIKGQDT